MIKCPYCGSTAQVKLNTPHTDKEGNYITAKYVCGCGTCFDEELNFLYEDKESGERFFVQCTSAAEAEAILLEEGFDLDGVVAIGIYDNDEAEALGYDTY